MTISTSSASATQTRSIGSFGHIAVAVLGFVLYISIWLGISQWQKHSAEETLHGPARGAERVYFDRIGDIGFGAGLHRLAHQIEETRSPGRYMAALDKWIKASTGPVSRDDATWVIELNERERAQVAAWLAEENVSSEQITQLHEKLEQVSPSLTASDTDVLKKLASYQSLMRLSDIQTQTLKALFAKLEELGVNEGGLKQLGLHNEWQRR